MDLARALNGLLPGTMRARGGDGTAGFHARRSATGKLYRYVLDTGPVQLPQRRRFAAHVPFLLDQERVREAALLYLGRHDFPPSPRRASSVKTTERTVRARKSPSKANTMTFEVEADGFLRKMVRSLVGAHRRRPRRPRRRRPSEGTRVRDRRAWPPPRPACGLTLVRVDYPPEVAPVLR
jgi:tRNA pseudouridine38-40 synthase